MVTPSRTAVSLTLLRIVGRLGVVPFMGIVNLLDTPMMWHREDANTLLPASRSKPYRFPTEIIGHAIWLYFHFSLSYRDVEA